MKFSLLMSIYHKEKAEYFNRCMKSIWDEQTIKPSEIILVKDGSLTNELDEAIDKWKEYLGDIFKVIPLEKNLGLGEALNIGLKHCSFELVARMDTDDIAVPNRFQKQLEVFKNKSKMDICSSWVGEFEDNEKEIISYRKVPKTHQEIAKFAKRRNPLNHPAVMYKKSSLLKAGGYLPMLWFEDYYLWVRMLLNNSKFYNIQEPLVMMRAGYGQLQRRSGRDYLIAEFNFLKKLYEIGFLNKKEFIENLFLRAIVRVLPKNLIKLIYKKLRG